MVRPNIRDLVPYTSAREQFMDYELTLLDANESSQGTIGLEENPYLLHRYPDPYQRELKSKLSALKGHPAAGMVLGNGSDEIIDLLIRIFCEPSRDEILITQPTYGMYKVCAHINNVRVLEVSLDQDFGLDAEGVLNAVQSTTKIIFLCSPNNPTANLLSEQAIVQILDNFPGIVVIDEAYIDFSPSQSLVSLCAQYPRLVVMQTFSKAWGLAGIRLGICYTSSEIAAYLNRIKPPYNVNQLSQQQALKALESADQLSINVQRILAHKAQLVQDLQDIPVVQKVFPSDTNFLLVRVHQAHLIFNYLIDQQVIVRNRSNVHLCQDCLRITIGTPEENDKLLTALKSYQP